MKWGGVERTRHRRFGAICRHSRSLPGRRDMALGLRRDNARFSSGSGADERHSVGARLWGGHQGLEYDAEGVVQFGTFAGLDIHAWTLASNLGYAWREVAWKPRIGVKANVASGDTNPHDGTSGTFYALFPRQGYFSELNLFTPSNFIDVHPWAQLKPSSDLTFTASIDALWRYSTSDAVYGPGRIAIPSSASTGSYVGITADLQVEWSISSQLSITGYLGRFFKGDVVSDAGGKDVDYAGVWMTYKF